jgi:excisionase family DNA binding protein
MPKVNRMTDYRSMTILEAAAFLGCSDRYVKMLLARGELDCWLLGPGSRRVLTAACLG